MKLTFKTLVLLVVVSAFISSCGNGNGKDETHDGHEQHDGHDHDQNEEEHNH